MSNDVTNLRDTILAKSDQLNADDIIGTGITITVTAVKRGDSAEQPVVIHYNGDNGRPYKPCKTMRRVLIAGWGENGAAWIGRSMTLYNEPSVKFGGVAVGGIRISHMTDIGNGISMATNASKGKKKEVIIQPLKITAPAPDAERQQGQEAGSHHSAAEDPVRSNDNARQADTGRRQMAASACSR